MNNTLYHITCKQFSLVLYKVFKMYLPRYLLITLILQKLFKNNWALYQTGTF